MRTTPGIPSRQREPVFNAPASIVASIVALLAIHALVSMLPSYEAFPYILEFGFVPAAWTLSFSPASLQEVLREALAGPGGTPSERLAFAQYVLGEARAAPWTPVTYAFLHGSWTHVALNCLWLAAFGTPIARRCGGVRFALLALVTAVAGAFAHWAAHPYGVVPVIGASGAVSGMMAAAARFVFTPVSFPVEPHLRPRQSFAELARNRRALLFFGIWFVINLVFGLLAVPLGLAEGGIAWEAHLGGFVAGLVLFPLLDPVGRGTAAPV